MCLSASSVFFAIQTESVGSAFALCVIVDLVAARGRVAGLEFVRRRMRGALARGGPGGRMLLFLFAYPPYGFVGSAFVCTAIPLWVGSLVNPARSIFVCLICSVIL